MDSMTRSGAFLLSAYALRQALDFLPFISRFYNRIYYNEK